MKKNREKTMTEEIFSYSDPCEFLLAIEGVRSNFVQQDESSNLPIGTILKHPAFFFISLNKLRQELIDS